MIDRSQLRDGLPPDRTMPDGSASVVLALANPETYTASNTYLPPWQTTTAAFYRNSPDHYCGWIDLEDLMIDAEEHEYKSG